MLTKLNRLSPGRPRRTRKPFRRTGRRTRLDTAVLTNTPVSPTELILKVMTDRCSSLSPLTYWRTNGEEQEPSYYPARYYEASAVKFLSEDPLGFVGGGNFYAYVENNPVDDMDPFGLQNCNCDVPKHPDDADPEKNIQDAENHGERWW